MWILYAGIAVATFSISNGIYNSTAASGFGTFFAIVFPSAIIYFIYSLTPRYTMLEEIYKKIKKEFLEHKNSLFSKYSLNSLTISMSFLLLVFCIRLNSLPIDFFEYGISFDNRFASLIALLAGMCVLLAFYLNYNSMPKSQKRDLEYWDQLTDMYIKDEINKYLQYKRDNPVLSEITYKGGHHKLGSKDIFCTLKISGDTFSIFKSYSGKQVIEFPVSDIISLSFETLEAGSDAIFSRPSMDTYEARMMYIEYLSEDDIRHTMRFSIGAKKVKVFAERVNELKSSVVIGKIAAIPPEPKQIKTKEPEETTPENNSNENYEEYSRRFVSIEDRLTKLKELYDKDLITADEYTERKAEIIKEV